MILSILLAVVIFAGAVSLGWMDRAKVRAGLDQVRRDAETSGLLPAYGEEDQ